MRILEELYFGNLCPHTGNITDKHYRKALAQQEELELKLGARLGEEDKKLFLSYVNNWATINGTDCVEHFILGFKLGAKLGFEVGGDDLRNCLDG